MKEVDKDRTYGQFCGLARALDVVGERWSLLLVRDLLLGPRRFRDLLTALDGIGPNLLTARLRALEAKGIVERTRPARAPHDLYGLTARGVALEPAIVALASWGSELLGEPGVDGRFDVGWMLLSLKRRYRPTPRALVVGLTLDGRSFTLELGGERLVVIEQPSLSPALRIEGDGLTLAHVLYRGRPIENALDAGTLRMSGDKALFVAMRRAFAAPL